MTIQKDSKSKVKVLPVEMEIEILKAKPSAPESWKKMGWRESNTPEKNTKIMDAAWKKMMEERKVATEKARKAATKNK